MIIYFKACPRCHGDATESMALEGTYLTCLQCGYELTDLDIVNAQRLSVLHAKESAAKVTVPDSKAS